MQNGFKSFILIACQNHNIWDKQNGLSKILKLNKIFNLFNGKNIKNTQTYLFLTLKYGY